MQTRRGPLRPNSLRVGPPRSSASGSRNAELDLFQGSIFRPISRGQSAGHFAAEGDELQPGRQTSAVYVRQLVKRLGREAGFERSISPHTLRHTAIARYLPGNGEYEGEVGEEASEL